MRLIWLAATIATSLVPVAQAAEVNVLVPPVVAAAGMRDLAVAYGKDTGQTLTLKMTPMDKMLQEAETGAPAADVVALPSDLMDQLEHDNGILPGSRKKIGRVEIALAVPAGAPHPDISTPEKFVAVLNGAKGVAYSNPAGGTMMAWIIQSMLLRPEFKNVHSVLIDRGNGISALAAGNSGADMALQLADEIDTNPKVSNVGPLPPLFGAHIDSDIAVLARTSDPKAAGGAIDYLLRPSSDAIWNSKHLARR
jgi:molybdate transport system substrate-binding protein